MQCTLILFFDTECNPGGANCVDGFYYNSYDVFVEGCTQIINPMEDLWCSTQVDSSGFHVSGQYTYCQPGCAADIETTCYDEYPIALDNGELCCAEAFRSNNCPHDTGNEVTNKILNTDPPECCNDGQSVPCPTGNCGSLGECLVVINLLWC